MEARTVANKWLFRSLGVFLITFLSIAFVENPSYQVREVVLVLLATSAGTALMASIYVIWDELVRFK